MGYITLINTQFDLEWLKDISIIIRNIVLDIFVALSPSLNYLFQARKFKKTKSSKGFSNFLCLTTLLSHTLKIFFWFGKRFKYTLLIQSVLVVLVQLYLIFLCIKFKEDVSKIISDLTNNPVSKKEKIKKFIYDNFINWSKTVNRKLIWRWTYINEYYKFYFLIIMILITFSSIIGIGNKYYINIIGTISIILEISCSLPQIIEMQKSKNQRNISKIMVFMWLTGNSIKIYYNIINKSPIQLIIGSGIQVFFNIILIFQIGYYYIKNRKESIISLHQGESNFVEEKPEKKKEELELSEVKKAIEKEP